MSAWVKFCGQHRSIFAAVLAVLSLHLCRSLYADQFGVFEISGAGE